MCADFRHLPGDQLFLGLLIGVDKLLGTFRLLILQLGCNHRKHILQLDHLLLDKPLLFTQLRLDVIRVLRRCLKRRPAHNGNSQQPAGER